MSNVAQNLDELPALHGTARVLLPQCPTVTTLLLLLLLLLL
jgi:hypothetical protein